jgi:hypothetical protein
MKNPSLCAAVLLLGLSALGACAAEPTADVQATAMATAASKAQVENRLPGQYRTEPKSFSDTASWASLFNGQDLTGWRTVNGQPAHAAKFHVEGGDLVGTNDPKCHLNTFLRTEQGYSDFLFTCEFKWDVGGNSGVQIRSHQRPWGKDAWDGRLWGYQVEMDEKARAWTGGLQEEGGGSARAWLHPLGKPGDADFEKFAAARHAVKLTEWNRLTVRAIGPRVETWLNGVPCTDYTEKTVTKDTQFGFFALQVHQGHDSQIRWRNLKVLPLGPVGPEPIPSAKDAK